MVIKKIPQPQTPQIWQRLQWVFHPLEFLESNARVLGDCFQFYLTNDAPVVLISNPEMIREIFSAPPEHFDTGRSNALMKPFLQEHSLFLLDGAAHQRQRRLLTPPFHGERMKSYGMTIYQIIQEVIAQWDVGIPFSPCAAMQEISLQVILKTIFGLYAGERYERIKQLLSSLLNISNSPWRAIPVYFPFLQVDLGAKSPWGEFIRKKKEVDQLVFDEIEERKSNFDTSRSDILNVLMSARDENGEAMTYEELRDELFTFLVAGQETTSIALSWALYSIHSMPTVREKLLAELETLDSFQDFKGINELPYLNAVCQETLRFQPINLMVLPRITKVPMRILDYEFLPETWLAPCIYLTHRRADLYPEPQVFQPQRFLERQYRPYEFFPFGGANRRCIGMALAMYEMKLVLATLLNHLELALVDHHSVKPVRRGFFLSPTQGNWLVVMGRR